MVVNFCSFCFAGSVGRGGHVFQMRTPTPTDAVKTTRKSRTRAREGCWTIGDFLRLIVTERITATRMRLCALEIGDVASHMRF